MEFCFHRVPIESNTQKEYRTVTHSRVRLCLHLDRKPMWIVQMYCDFPLCVCVCVCTVYACMRLWHILCECLCHTLTVSSCVGDCQCGETTLFRYLAPSPSVCIRSNWKRADKENRLAASQPFFPCLRCVFLLGLQTKIKHFSVV